MKICLLGGTGTIGTYLQELLKKEEGDNIFVTTRNKSAKDIKNIHFLHGNAKDIQFVKSLDNNFDVVVDFMSYKTDEFANRVAMLLNKTKHYVFLSSARVFANDKVITEESPRLLDVSKDKQYLETDEYALTKARQEDILNSCNKRNYTIIRPYITYGKERLQLSVLEKEEWLFRALTNRSIVFCKELANKSTTLTDSRDVAKSIFKILRGGGKGETINITNDYSITWAQVLDIYVEELTKALGEIPNISWVTLDKFVELYRPGISKYQITVDRMFNRVFDNGKLSNIIDTKLFVHPEDGVRLCITSFLDNPHFRYVNWRKEAYIDCQIKERVSLNDIKGLKNIIKYYYNRYIGKI